MLKIIFRFALIVMALLILFQLSNASLFIPSIPADALIGIGAAILIGLGVYFGSSFKKEKIVEVGPSIEVDTQKIKELGLSERELEVLGLIAEGLSDKQIGDKLFVSESTVKTHVFNLFVKLDVKRRTQAVTQAKEWRILI